MDENKDWTCSVSQSDCNTDPKCKKVSETCIETENGICTTIKQEYTCTETESQCTQYQTTNSCTNITLTEPAVDSPAQDGSFNKAVGASNLIEQIKNNSSGNPLRVFPGSEMHCTENDYCGSTGTCCCHKDADKHGNFLGMIKCSDSEQELYAKRKKGLDVYLASGCVDGIGDPFGDGCMYCTAKRWWYCTFDNKLAKEVQVQGRRQLAQLASQGYGDAVKKHFNFSFYGSGNRWVDMGTVNGNRIWRYQYDTSCNSISPPSNMNCPAILTTYFAVCDNNGCSSPNVPPPQKQSDDRLNIVSVNPLNTKLTTLSKNVVANGGCDSNGNCSYDISAWKGGYFKTDLAFYLSNPTGAGSWSDPVQIRDLDISAYTYGQNEDAKQLKLRYRPQNSSKYITQTLPLSIDPTPVTYIPSTSIRIYGSCDKDSNYCSYTLISPLGAYAKPFLIDRDKSGCSTSVTADCSGFTIEQLSLLDFSKMDLSSLVSDLTPQTPNQTEMQQIAQKQVDNNQVNSSTETGDIVAWIDKGNCINSCTVNLSTVQNWLPANIKVKQVSIAWGDGGTNSGTYIYNFSHNYSRIGNFTIQVHFTLENGDKHYAELNVQVKDKYDPPTTGATHVSLEAKPLW
ncbi:hypothetical protein JCM17795_16310 [Galenea microaerophila]